MNVRKVKCDICSARLLLEKDATYFKHIQSHHQQCKGFFVRCKVIDCIAEYNKFASYKRHWFRDHHVRLTNINDINEQDIAGKYKINVQQSIEKLIY